MVCRILFVEDEAAQRSLCKDAVADWNESNVSPVFELELAEDYGSAESLLERIRFDCALFDLRLPGETGKTATGGKLAASGLGEYGIPVGIISGKPSDFDRSSVGHGMLNVFDKGDKDPYGSALSWFASQWPMMEVLEAARSRIRKSGAEVFASRLWPRWADYEGLPQMDQDTLAAIVTRQFASHIADLLGLDDGSNVDWHPFENYVSPALQDAKPYTGDIFKFDDAYWVVMTPQCDMATGSSDTVILAHCESGVPNWDENVALLSQALNEKNAERRDKYFRNLVNQNSGPSRHFLPPLFDTHPLMVDFKTLTVRPLQELKDNLDNRIASVATPFLPNLTQRFGAYISRAGQPNLNFRHFA